MGTNRRVLITGGTGAIGSILVKGMINDGHFVVFTSTSKQSGKKLIETNNLSLDLCHFVRANFEEGMDIASWVENLPFKVDTVIHSARSLDNLKLDVKGKLTPDQIQKEHYLSVTFPYLLTNALKESGHPLKDIIFLSSMYGVVAPNPSLYADFERQSPLNYGVSKAAQIHLTKELAVRFAMDGIRVNCISYGGLEGRTDEEFINKYKKLVPMRRMLNHTDLYPPVQFIINNPTVSITGENIKIDGGWTVW